MTYTSSQRAMDLVTRSAHVRVYSRAIGAESLMAEGEVIGYCSAPTLLIRHADGSKSSWSVDLRVEEVAPHDYLSTACLHSEHGYCAAPVGQAGPKVPATCKFCSARCQCVCHDAASAEGADRG